MSKFPKLRPQSHYAWFSNSARDDFPFLGYKDDAPSLHFIAADYYGESYPAGFPVSEDFAKAWKREFHANRQLSESGLSVFVKTLNFYDLDLILNAHKRPPALESDWEALASKLMEEKLLLDPAPVWSASGNSLTKFCASERADRIRAMSPPPAPLGPPKAPPKARTAETKAPSPAACRVAAQLTPPQVEVMLYLRGGWVRPWASPRPQAPLHELALMSPQLIYSRSLSGYSLTDFGMEVQQALRDSNQKDPAE